ncbi:Solitary outer membrane autotransporter beta-barrel domain [Vibrio lentus]|nr:Solitary outer membrane autotransporter beta-barrel domain [Vibrio lentus]
MYSSIRRIDIGVILWHLWALHLTTRAVLAGLLNPNLFNDWVDNVGIGFTINYGSSRRELGYLLQPRLSFTKI